MMLRSNLLGWNTLALNISIYLFFYIAIEVLQNSERKLRFQQLINKDQHQVLRGKYLLKIIELYNSNNTIQIRWGGNSVDRYNYILSWWTSNSTVSNVYINHWDYSSLEKLIQCKRYDGMYYCSFTEAQLNTHIYYFQVTRHYWWEFNHGDVTPVLKMLKPYKGII